VRRERERKKEGEERMSSQLSLSTTFLLFLPSILEKKRDRRKKGRKEGGGWPSNSASRISRCFLISPYFLLGGKGEAKGKDWKERKKRKKKGKEKRGRRAPKSFLSYNPFLDHVKRKEEKR